MKEHFYLRFAFSSGVAGGGGALGPQRLGLCPKPRLGLPRPDPLLHGVCGVAPAGFRAEPQLPCAHDSIKPAGLVSPR